MSERPKLIRSERLAADSAFPPFKVAAPMPKGTAVPPQMTNPPQAVSSQPDSL